MVILHNKNIQIDLSKYVDPLSINIHLSIDGEYNYGSLVIPAISGEIGGIDFSRPTPKYYRIVVNGFYFRTGESEVKQEGNFWRHELTLIAPKKIASRKPLPNMTLTQPKGDYGRYVRSAFDLTNKQDSIVYNLAEGYETVGFKISEPDGKLELSLENTTTSTDTNIIDGMILKEANNEYELKLYLSIYQPFASADLTGATFEVRVEVNGYSIYYKRLDAERAKLGKRGIVPDIIIFNDTIRHRSITEDEEVKVFVRAFGMEEWDYGYVDYYITDCQFTIFSKKDVIVEPKYLDYWVKKLIRLSKSNYVLEKNSEERLKKILSPEFTYNEYDLKTALDEIAESIGAVVTIEEFGNQDVIAFKFYDDMERVPIVDMPNVMFTSKKTDIENYVSELELNATNLINDISRPVPFEGGTMSLRALNPNTQMGDTNISVSAPLGIYYITKFIVKGLEIKTDERTITEHDITRRVVEQARWNALPKVSDYSMNGRLFGNANQNNTLYFIEGDKRIYNMGGTGTLAPTFLGTNRSNRALWEACAAEVSEKYGELVTNQDEGLSITHDIEIYFEYISYGQTRASVYKEDQSGFIERLAKFYNETARLNDPASLGKSAQSVVNRLGNTIISYVGYATELWQLGTIGGLNTKGEKLVSLTLTWGANEINYVANYVKDFNIKSRHIGIKSAIRQYEVPITDLVERVDKRNVEIMIGGGHQAYVPAYNMNILLNQPKKTPTFAKITFQREGADYISIGASVNEIIIGNSITWNLAMPDNYSAGSQKVEARINGVRTFWDEEIRYTNEYGSVGTVRIDYYTHYRDMAKQERDKYPLIDNIVQGDYLYNFIYNCDKDAREIWNHTLQRVFLGSNGVTIYNMGLEDYDVRLAVFNYVPSKQAKKVDIGRIRTVANTTTISTNLITVTLPAGKTAGYGWYDIKTNDLILFKEGNLGGIQSIPFGGKVI